MYTYTLPEAESQPIAPRLRTELCLGPEEKVKQFCAVPGSGLAYHSTSTTSSFIQSWAPPAHLPQRHFPKHSVLSHHSVLLGSFTPLRLGIRSASRCSPATIACVSPLPSTLSPKNKRFRGLPGAEVSEVYLQGYTRNTIYRNIERMLGGPFATSPAGLGKKRHHPLTTNSRLASRRFDASTTGIALV